MGRTSSGFLPSRRETNLWTCLGTDEDRRVLSEEAKDFFWGKGRKEEKNRNDEDEVSEEADRKQDCSGANRLWRLARRSKAERPVPRRQVSQDNYVSQWGHAPFGPRNR